MCVILYIYTCNTYFKIIKYLTMIINIFKIFNNSINITIVLIILQKHCRKEARKQFLSHTFSFSLEK